MEILKKPIITEKTQKLQDKAGKYTFLVDKKSNKIEVKKAIEKMYGVNVVDVNTAIIPSKPKSKFTKTAVISGRRGAYKKAVVKLAEGETIDFFMDL